MEQSLSENLQLGQLVANALSEIERLGYSRRSRNRYRAMWEHLIEFSRRNQLEDKFSADLAARFLRSMASGARRWMSRATAGVGICGSA